MSSSLAKRAALPPWPFDPQNFLFSLGSYAAAALTLGVCFASSLDRPWWALLTRVTGPWLSSL